MELHLCLKKKKINLVWCMLFLWLCNNFSLFMKLYFDYRRDFILYGLVMNKRHVKIILWWWWLLLKCEGKSLQLLVYILSELNGHFNILK